MSSIGNQSQCQVCSAPSLETILPLGFHPLPSAYLTAAQLHEEEVTYPLTLARCAACGLLQLDYIPDPKRVFPPEYPYQSGLTNMLVRNFQALAESVIPAYQLAPESLVVDIGSNDGSLLKAFKERGMKVLGIEPTDNAKLANERGIETIQEYVTVDVAKAAVATRWLRANSVRVGAATTGTRRARDGQRRVAIVGTQSVFGRALRHRGRQRSRSGESGPPGRSARQQRHHGSRRAGRYVLRARPRRECEWDEQAVE